MDELINEFTAEAAGEDDQFLNFLLALEKHVILPCDGFVIGEPVSVIKFDYQGNQRLGLTVKCRRTDGREYEVAASAAVLAPDIPGSPYLAAYRKWMGLDPSSDETPARTRRVAPATGLNLRGPVELVVLSVKQRAARCRLLGSQQMVTLRAGRLWDVVPGEIAVVKPGKQWNHSRNPYLSGVIESTRLDVAALGLVPLRLEEWGLWDPAKHYWGEKGDQIDDWAKPMIARGPRREFTMEQVLPGADSDDPFSDPIIDSNDLKDSGDGEGAYRILMDLCLADLRCLDAHAHLGNLAFDRLPKEAIRHYAVGVRIGELSLPEGFDGLLPWGRIDNRPFLRCMQGFGLCLWRLGRFDEAGRIFERMLWLNPSDNQGVRFLIDDVRSKVAWDKSRHA